MEHWGEAEWTARDLAPPRPVDVRSLGYIFELGERDIVALADRPTSLREVEAAYVEHCFKPAAAHIFEKLIADLAADNVIPIRRPRP